MAAAFACRLNIFYIHQAFILFFHKPLHPPSLFLSLYVHLSLSLSLSLPSSLSLSLSLALPPSLSLSLSPFLAGWRCWCFLLAIQSSLQLDTCTIQCTHPVTISTLDAVVPSSDHCRTETILPPSDHYCIEKVAPPGDHYCIEIVV